MYEANLVWSTLTILMPASTTKGQLISEAIFLASDLPKSNPSKKFVCFLGDLKPKQIASELIIRPLLTAKNQ